MNADDLLALATYNSEKARGLVHTPDWVLRMAELQVQFNREYAAKAKLTIVPTPKGER